MSKIAVLVDSTCSLTLEQMKENDITVIPLSVICDEKEYTDLYDIHNEDLCAMLAEGKLPKTSQPAIGTIEQILSEKVKEGFDTLIIYTIHSDLSGTYANIKMAAEQLDGCTCYIIDTRSAAYAVGYMAEKAARMIKEGNSVEDILKMSKEMISHTVTYIYPFELETLKRGGRISKTAASMASLLKLKPLLILEKEGTIIEKLGIARTRKNVFEMILDDLSKRGIDAEHYFLNVPYIDKREDAEAFVEMAKERFAGIECIYTGLPAVITSHIGLGAFGVQPVWK